MYPSFSQYVGRIVQNFQVLSDLAPVVDQAASKMEMAIRSGNKIMFCGNGGSAADAQHLAAELTGRYLKDRVPLAAVALTVDSSALTAIANDYGYALIFERQLRGLGRAGDVLVGLSTSGNSENVLRAVMAARTMGIATIGFTGRDGGRLRAECDLTLCAPADETNHIQEMHIAMGHYLCGRVENAVC